MRNYRIIKQRSTADKAKAEIKSWISIYIKGIEKKMAVNKLNKQKAENHVGKYNKCK